MRSNGRDRLAQHGREPSAIPASILARARRGGQPAEILPDQPRPADGQYAFLIGAPLDAAILRHAEAEGDRCGVAAHQVLLAAGTISQMAYAAALARSLGVALAGWETAFDLETAEDADDMEELGLPAHAGGRPCRVLSAEEGTPREVRRRVEALQARGMHVALAPRSRIDAALEEHGKGERIDRAVRSLCRRWPVHSALGPVWYRQNIAAAIAVGLIVGGFSLLPEATIAAVSAIIALPFLCVTLLRVVALGEVVATSRRRMQEDRPDVPRPPDRLLPVYTVLVPLLREASVLPGLVQALRALDYPPAKLEIFLVLEAADAETQAALLELPLPGNFRTIIVPDAAPHTKPKALNYALQFARGEYVVVFDAEDRPQRDQLRRALDTFRRNPPALGCVQAQLNIHNARDSWFSRGIMAQTPQAIIPFSRQFTIEYSALFDAILPALARLGLPVPLGGTSNHFPRETLVAAGGWDPFNVTEDADLGFRLARQGWRTAVLHSTTWEEAPVAFGQWFRQRTRWLKGWMQTYLMHTRQPWRLSAELGPRGAIGFHALMGGLILSALVHPLFYALLAYHAVSGQLFAPADTVAGSAFWTIAWINLALSYVVSILVGALSVWRRGRRSLALSALFMPLAWLLMSAAAYRALYQLVFDPYLWEKTEHGVGRRARGRKLRSSGMRKREARGGRA